MKYVLFYFIFLIFCLNYSQSLKRCFKCRSRGEKGSCKDKFIYNNLTQFDKVHGIEAEACPSGWCGKILEKGTNAFKDEEYGAATQRMCLLRGPVDDEERCAPTLQGHETVFMCFCKSDLCNSSPSVHFLGVLSPLVFFPLLVR